MIKKIVSMVVFLLAIVYVFHGMNMKLLVRSFSSFSLGALLALVAAFVVSYVFVALRWTFISRKTIGFIASYEAAAICVGVNNIMPARLGDVSRLLFLKKVYGVPLHKTLVMTFVERLFDILGLVTIGLSMVGYAPNIRLYIFPTLLLVLVVCACLCLIIRYPIQLIKVLKKVPYRKIRKFTIEVVVQLRTMTLVYFLQLYALTLLVWGYYIIVMLIFSKLSPQLHLSLSAVITVFVISSLGVSIPSTPASIGLYEATVILTLSWFGIGKEIALSFAFVYHTLMIVTSVALAFLVMYRKGFRYSSDIRGTSQNKAASMS